MYFIFLKKNFYKLYYYWKQVIFVTGFLPLSIYFFLFYFGKPQLDLNNGHDVYTGNWFYDYFTLFFAPDVSENRKLMDQTSINLNLIPINYIPCENKTDMMNKNLLADNNFFNVYFSNVSNERLIYEIASDDQNINKKLFSDTDFIRDAIMVGYVKSTIAIQYHIERNYLKMFQ